MSQYLVERITSQRPTSRCGTAPRSWPCRGDGHLESLTLADRATGDDARSVPASWLFVFIGASPRTDWLGAGRASATSTASSSPGGPARAPAARQRWPLARAPYSLETSVPGVFAAGDVRLDSMKRVASAVGEGAMAVYLVHRYLATI